MENWVTTNKHSFVTRLQTNDGRKQFARKVEDGEKAEILHSASRRYTLRRSPTDYDWTPGERVVLVAFTGAGMVPTSTYGTFQGLTKGSNGRKAAMVQWEQKHPFISGTVAIQRIRPIACLSK
jgi:hypothetical protein